jgi:hypothetical protein
VLPVGSIYQGADDREGETVGDAARYPRNDRPCAPSIFMLTEDVFLIFSQSALLEKESAL